MGTASLYTFLLFFFAVIALHSGHGVDGDLLATTMMNSSFTPTLLLLSCNEEYILV
jgi:hypothetical protein